MCNEIEVGWKQKYVVYKGTHYERMPVKQLCDICTSTHGEPHDYGCDNEKCPVCIKEGKDLILGLCDCDSDTVALEDCADNYIEQAIKALSPLWAYEPLDGDETKEIADLILKQLDEANGNMP
jgi:hypothetical protein